MANINPVVAPKITTNDINDYRSRLANISSDGKALDPSSISSSLYSTVKPPVVTPTVYPTPDGKAPVINPVVAPPASGGGSSYVVKSGDSLSKIATQNRMTLDQLLALNPNYKANPSLVKVGATINVAGGAPVNTPPPTVTPPAGGGAPVLTPEQTATDLAKKAGEAGLSVDEYQKLVASQNIVSKEESDKIAKELGIPAVEGQVFAKPSKSSEQLFNSAYATAGLADVKSKISALDKEITRARSDLTEAIGAIDENPFLTETSRVGRGKRVLDQAEQKINNLLSQKQQYNDLYTQGVTEINNSILRQQADFKTNNDLSVAQLNYLLAKADKEVATLKETKGTPSAGSISAYLSSAVAGKAPTTIGNSESGFYKYDPVTKKFIQVVAPSALSVAQTKKAIADANNSGGDNSFKPTADQKALVGRFANSTEGVALGITAEDKAKMYSDSNFFYWILQKATEAGFY